MKRFAFILAIVSLCQPLAAQNPPARPKITVELMGFTPAGHPCWHLCTAPHAKP